MSRSWSARLLAVACLVACAEARPAPSEPSPPPPAQPNGGTGAKDAAAPSADAGPTTGASDPLDAATDATASAPPARAPVPCEARPRQGDACDPALGIQCLTYQCGVVRELECVPSGLWVFVPAGALPGGSTDGFVCRPEDETSPAFCMNQVQCCGQPVEPSTGCPTDGGCELCPSAEPVDGAPCSLPSSCDGSSAPKVIDCYYRCCCYGTATWAQCDGQRWRVTTNCSSK